MESNEHNKVTKQTRIRGKEQTERSQRGTEEISQRTLAKRCPNAQPMDTDCSVVKAGVGGGGVKTRTSFNSVNN